MDPHSPGPQFSPGPQAEPKPETVGSVTPVESAPPVQSGAGALSSREVDMLGFERQWWKFAGAKDQAIRELFDMSATRYYQVLNTLIDRPEALERDPMLVKRLRRTREARRRAGSARSAGAHA